MIVHAFIGQYCILTREYSCCQTHCANSTAGVKLCPSRRTSGILSYQFRYCVYMLKSSLAVRGLPGECRIYKDWCTSSLSSQKHLYTDRTLDGCWQDRCNGAPGIISNWFQHRWASNSPSSVYGTHKEASMSPIIAGLGGRCGKQEHCGSEPVARDHALQK